LKVIIVSFKHGEEIEIECLGWGYSQKGNIYHFYSDVEGKVITSAFSTYNWDIININHEASSGITK